MDAQATNPPQLALNRGHGDSNDAPDTDRSVDHASPASSVNLVQGTISGATQALDQGVRFDSTEFYQIIGRTRRIESPCAHPELFTIKSDFEAQSPEMKDRVLKLIYAATTGCPTFTPLMGEGQAESILRGMPGEGGWPGLLRLLYWRAREQMNVWLIFQALCYKGFTDYRTSLRASIDFSGNFTQASGAIFSVLASFTIPRSRHETPFPFSEYEKADAPLEWLAVVIARGFKHPTKMFEFIERTGFLGKFDEADFIHKKGLDKPGKPPFSLLIEVYPNRCPS